MLSEFVSAFITVRQAGNAQEAARDESKAVLEHGQHIKRARAQVTVMLPPIEQVGSQHFNAVTKRRVAGTPPTKVCGRGLGHKNNFPAGIPESLAPIDIFSIKKEALIQHSH